MPSRRMDVPTSRIGFPTTRWSLIFQARENDERALNDLLRPYLVPVTAYARKKGYQESDAEDIAQTVFERMLKKDFLTPDLESPTPTAAPARPSPPAPAGGRAAGTRSPPPAPPSGRDSAKSSPGSC